MMLLAAEVDSDEDSETGSVHSSTMSKSSKQEQKSERRGVRRKPALLAGVDDVDKMKVLSFSLLVGVSCWLYLLSLVGALSQCEDCAICCSVSQSQ